MLGENYLFSVTRIFGNFLVGTGKFFSFKTGIPGGLACKDNVSRNCVTNVWARGLPVFMAVWRLQIVFEYSSLKIKLELY